ncbi:recombinase family protein [Paeniglutamicibacter cryotolerans]|uniref:DNA invertase Pin-like site-specific DNA recombinase n=1 Tax=Paeniglutamicibacter cryotolerans TaxID=670079 RepID=A0A839QPI2_9MICC|nr:recombinase family protein [Paeniglutamicibacter cryotolerans]MBB2997513.1 DNA invertase Pin-like site-specific DNA recombinase [Paeniglutamicibacter cryotolerans]
MSNTATTGKLIGYARVSTRGQDSDRQVQDITAAGVRADDMYVDNGVSGGKASRPAFDAARVALQPGDTLVVTTLDRLGRSTSNMLELATELERAGVNLRVLNLGGGDVDTGSPMGKLMFTVMAGLAEMELAIKTERIRDSNAKRAAAGGDLGGRPATHSDDSIHGAARDIKAGMSASAAAAKRGMSRATLYRRAKALGVDLAA